LPRGRGAGIIGRKVINNELQIVIFLSFIVFQVKASFFKNKAVKGEF
jgi:hypothetical protein